LQRLARAVAKKRVWLRYQAVILAFRGRSAASIARALGCGVRSVQDRVARPTRGGPEALRERPHPGRPPRLSGPELARFRERLEAGPTPEDGIRTSYGPDLRRILEREFRVALGRQAVHDLLHRHGFSSLMPRPQYRDADEGSRSRPEGDNSAAASKLWHCSVAPQRLADTSVDQTDARKRPEDSPRAELVSQRPSSSRPP
jgi:putative transposase